MTSSDLALWIYRGLPVHDQYANIWYCIDWNHTKIPHRNRLGMILGMTSRRTANHQPKRGLNKVTHLAGFSGARDPLPQFVQRRHNLGIPRNRTDTSFSGLWISEGRWCPGSESNRYALLRARDFKSRASASFATRAD